MASGDCPFFFFRNNDQLTAFSISLSGISQSIEMLKNKAPEIAGCTYAIGMAAAYAICEMIPFRECF